MTSKDLINSGKYFQFPTEENTYKEYGIDTEKFPLTDKRYVGFPDNGHHFFYDYAYEFVLPKICESCGIDFDINLFVKRNHIVEYDGNEYDFSYIVPKENEKYHYKIYGYEYDIEYDCDYNGLMQYDNDIVNGIAWSTEYHNAYAFPHSCSRIISYNSLTDKKLFISGDSQMIPSIAPLTIYFKEVWYFDNRTKDDKCYKDNYKDVVFDDVLFVFYNKSLGEYMGKNLD